MGGQLWPGGWYWGGAWTSYFREVCQLELPGDLWDRGQAYEATIESACWWWPFRDFVIVCERPVEIHRELVDETRQRGWGSHRLHSETGPAVFWPDGWGVYSWHGVRVPAKVIEAPETLTRDEVLAERNIEIRRAMFERIGTERYIDLLGVRAVQTDEYGTLYRAPQTDDEDLVVVKVVNSTAEPDGTFKDYWLRVPPDVTTAREAVAWTFAVDASDYELEVQS